VHLEQYKLYRKFDEASGTLVETTNQLTRKGLLLGIVAVVLSAASLLISVIVLVK